jgi:phosphatidylinositol alpha-mannosyltransferase
VRIALACAYAWDAPGGVQNHVRQLAAHLRERGHDTLVLAPAFARDVEPGLEVIGRPIRVPFNGSVAPICPDPRSRGRIHRAMAAFRPDVVHAHEPFAPSTSLFATLAARAPVVATSHTYFERSLTFPAYARVLRRVWRRPVLWLAVSDASARFLRHHLGPGADIRVVPNGVEVDAFHDAEPAELPSGRRLLFVSRLEPRKGFAVAVRAFVLLAPGFPDLSLVVAGEGPERSALRTLSPAVRARVIMLGSVPYERLPPYHAAAHAFVAPATGRESFGYILVEAMAAGLPVVASDIPGYREVVQDGRDGLLVPPGDPGALAEGVRKVLTNPGLARRLGQAGPARARRFRWEAVAAEIESAYADALRRPEARW